ncbi:hypothetical protein N7536_008176 [Penicillium majusculum]|nr:hypothetical protein N7536_008176 [Penicillium majusculum]
MRSHDSPWQACLWQMSPRGYHTPRHAIQPVSPPSFDHPIHPHSMNTIPGSIVLSFFSFYLHTRPFAETLFLIVIMEIDHLEFILLPKNPQQPHKVSKRNLVNGERFNAIFF